MTKEQTTNAAAVGLNAGLGRHTPGPWSSTGTKVEGQDGETIAVITEYKHPTPRQKANALLIAAAPHLLAALKEFSDYVHAEQCSTDGAVTYSNTEINRLVFLARTAIARATGAA